MLRAFEEDPSFIPTMHVDAVTLAPRWSEASGFFVDLYSHAHTAPLPTQTNKYMLKDSI